MTIKMAFFFGLLFSLISFGISMLVQIGIVGIFIASVFTAYFGTIVNKAVLEVYRECNGIH
ncbi:hypothetical protein [Desulfuribacillus alkaliarsenatis]|uniref:hypothetical protein n=1 Tax=Desulfuribacillus alkaliarsenatis TaxID=766136 RepID=UPI00114D0C0C|nr:hypothetical protein [Desulfuribacillus alkaliarsenatis]